LAFTRDFFNAFSRRPARNANFCGPDSAILTGVVVELVVPFFFFDPEVSFGAGAETRTVAILR